MKKYTIICQGPFNLTTVSDSNNSLYFLTKFPTKDLDRSSTLDVLSNLKQYMHLTQDQSNPACKTLLRIHEILPEDSYIYIILSYIETSCNITESRLLKILEYGRLALLFLHSKGIIHCNVTESNFFFNDSDCKLGLPSLDSFSPRMKAASLNLGYSPVEFRKNRLVNQDFQSLYNTVKSLSEEHKCSSVGLEYLLKTVSNIVPKSGSYRESIFLGNSKTKHQIKHVSFFDELAPSNQRIPRLETKRPVELLIPKDKVFEMKESERLALPPLTLSKPSSKIGQLVTKSVVVFKAPTPVHSINLTRKKVSIKDLV